MKKRKWHFGGYATLQPSVVCSCLSPFSQSKKIRLLAACRYDCLDPIEKRKRPQLKDRCKKCMSAVPKLSISLKVNGFWFRKRGD